jgi:hypothetical protein
LKNKWLRLWEVQSVKGENKMVTIHVLAAGELFQHVLNAIAAFMKQDSFIGLLRITALIPTLSN